MYPAFEVNSKDNLSGFGRLLWQRRIAHMIRADGDMQMVLVADRERISEAQQLFAQWQRGEVSAAEQDPVDVVSWFSPGGVSQGLTGALARTPLSLLTVTACVVLAVLTLSLDNRELFLALLYPDFAFGGRTIYLSRVLEQFGLRDFFNMISPILLHGGYVHLAFNMLWFWEFGKRIEAVQSSWVLLAIVILIALVSNTAQYLLGGGNNFVGMSGVVYGQLAWIWMWQIINPQRGLGLPMGLIIIMVISLVLLTMADLSMIANEAHIAGLLCGMVLGAAAATLSRFSSRGGRHHG